MAADDWYSISCLMFTFQVLELYPEFAESFANNLQVTFSMRDVSSAAYIYVIEIFIWFNVAQKFVR